LDSGHDRHDAGSAEHHYMAFRHHFGLLCARVTPARPVPMTDDEPHSRFLLVGFLGLSDAELRIVRKFARHFPAFVIAVAVAYSISVD
jgi:hypothetical protein